MQCVPFQNKQDTMYGLTFCRSAAGGTIGIGAHFQNYSSTGYQSSYSIWKGQSSGFHLHIRFKPGERVTAVWIVSCKGGFFDYPYLAVSNIREHVVLKSKIISCILLSLTFRYRQARVTFMSWRHNFRKPE